MLRKTPRCVGETCPPIVVEFFCMHITFCEEVSNTAAPEPATAEASRGQLTSNIIEKAGQADTKQSQNQTRPAI